MSSQVKLYKARMELRSHVEAHLNNPDAYCKSCGVLLPRKYRHKLCDVCAEWAGDHINRLSLLVR